MSQLCLNFLILFLFFKNKERKRRHRHEPRRQTGVLLRRLVFVVPPLGPRRPAQDAEQEKRQNARVGGKNYRQGHGAREIGETGQFFLWVKGRKAAPDQFFRDGLADF